MPETWRVISDLHYGDRASRIRSLRQVAPLFEGPGRVLLNGDTLDSRAGPHPQRTAEVREEVLDFLKREAPSTMLLTGNHDPDLSQHHWADLAGGKVFVTHGDVLYHDIVPWGRDASLVRERIAAGMARLDPEQRASLDSILGVFRSVAASVPQRHQSEQNPWKHLASFALDTIWPPDKILKVLQTWRQAPERAAALARTHRPSCRFVLIGHLHRPGAWKTRDGRWVINTGSFCPPLGGNAVDIAGDTLAIRRIEKRRGEFRIGEVVVQFSLADG